MTRIGRSFEDYLADDVLRWAVERRLMIVGEALTVLRRIAPGTAARIPGLPQIIAFRNILVHGYAGVDDKAGLGCHCSGAGNTHHDPHDVIRDTN
jgi:uncharacterized protein with HEPN domain